MITDAQHGKARIVDVTPVRVREALDAGRVAIVAGFQGFNRDTGDITTLGRGGSDTTAVALAAALDADVCEIYTDVDGIFTADPRVVPKARKIDRITSEEMLELAASGAKVLYIRAVEYARRHGVTLHVRSSFNNNEGTLVYNPAEGEPVEEPIITGVAGDLSEGKITVVGVPDLPGKAAEIFTIVAQDGREHRHDRPERVGRVDRASPTSRSPCRSPRAQTVLPALAVEKARHRLREHPARRPDRQARPRRRRHAHERRRLGAALHALCASAASTSR